MRQLNSTVVNLPTVNQPMIFRRTPDHREMLTEQCETWIDEVRMRVGHP